MSVESANPGVGGNNNPADKHPAFPGLDFDAEMTEWNPGDKAVYKASDIGNLQKTEYFVNVEGAEKLKKQAEKQEQLRREQIKKELDEEDRKQAEAARARGKLNRKEQREANREIAKADKAKVMQAIARRRVPIIVAILIIAITTAAIIILPQINASIVAENNNKFIQNNSTPMLDVYREVVTKKLSQEQLTKIVSENKDANIVVDFYPESCIIHPSGSESETIRAIKNGVNGGTFTDFVYENRTSDEAIVILKEYDGYKYYRGAEEHAYKTIDEAIDASILGKKEGAK